APALAAPAPPGPAPPGWAPPGLLPEPAPPGRLALVVPAGWDAACLPLFGCPVTGSIRRLSRITGPMGSSGAVIRRLHLRLRRRSRRRRHLRLAGRRSRTRRNQGFPA